MAKTNLPTAQELRWTGDWEKRGVFTDAYGLRLDGETGDFRVELWEHVDDGTKVHVAVSREFGIADVFADWPGNCAAVKRSYR